MFYLTANLTTLGRSDKKLGGEGAWLTGTLLQRAPESLMHHLVRERLLCRIMTL